jgi:hypothetical protein
MARPARWNCCWRWGPTWMIARLDGMTAVHLAQLPGTPKVIYDLMMLGQEENHE